MRCIFWIQFIREHNKSNNTMKLQSICITMMISLASYSFVEIHNDLSVYNSMKVNGSSYEESQIARSACYTKETKLPVSRISILSPILSTLPSATRIPAQEEYISTALRNICHYRLSRKCKCTILYVWQNLLLHLCEVFYH